MMCGLVATGPVLTGCQRDASATSRPATPAPRIVLDTPESAACSVLESLHAHLQAVAAHDRAGAAEIRDRVAEEIAARDEILSRHRRRPGESVDARDEYVRNCVESWAAIVSYYVDGITWGRVRLEASTQPRRQVVRVPARHADDEAVIRVSCVLDDAGKWRVRAIDFAKPEAPASQPTSAPQGAAEP